MKSLTENKLFYIFVLSAMVYFGQGIESLPSNALFFYMKETLHYTESTIMFINSLIGIAWLIKPLIGYTVDKLSKKFWIIGSLIVSILTAMYLGISPYLAMPVIIGLLMIDDYNTATRDVTVDGIMCIEGKKHKVTGKIQSVQWIAITVASILTGIGGGYISEHFSYQLGYLLLIPFYLLMIGVALKYKEKKIVKKSRISFLSTVKKLFNDRNLLLVALFIFLYKFSPSIGTPLTFIERDVFGWSKLWIGTLETISSIMGIIGACFYWHFSKKLNIKKWLLWSVFIGALTTLLYLYFTPITAIIYLVINSVLGMFFSLAVLDFMARNTQRGLEATSFALLCSSSNLASTCNSLVGGLLFPIVGLKWLIIISATTSFLCLPLINKIRFQEK